MKKRLLGLIVALACTLIVRGQGAGCPEVSAGANVTLPCGTNCTNLTATYFNTGGTTAYTVSSIPYNPYSYTSGSTYLNGVDDEWGSVLTLPFNFCFFGNTYNQCVIGSNGIICFDPSVANSYNAWPLTSGGPIPTTNFQGNTIMGPYEDIDPAISGYIYYNTLGVAPCRTFVVSFTNIPDYSCTSQIATSQIVLYETTNVIEVNIQKKPICSSWNGGLAIEGIQNAAGTVAYPVTGRNNTQWTATNDAYRWTPTGTSIVSVSWSQGGTVLGSAAGNATQAYTLNVCPPGGGVVPYVATATYTRCDGTTVVETDTVDVIRTNSAGPAILVPCLTSLPGGTATMAATGTGTWTTQAGNPGTAVITNPSDPLTTITTFSDTGTYHFIWSVVGGVCTDTTTVTVNLKPDAGPDQLVTCVTLPGGSATMAAVGAGTWTAAAGNPGTATITTPGSPSTTITTFSAAGAYNFVWTSSATGCTDTAMVTVIPAANAGPDQAVKCAPLPGGTATMAAVQGGGVWTPQPGNPGTAVITIPTSGISTITNFSAIGTYYFIWTIGACSDTAAVTVTTVPTLSPTVVDITCTNAIGVIYANAGGASPFSYQWSTGSITDSINTVTAGVTYTVTVTDNNLCTAVASASVANQIIIVSLTDSIQEVSCYGYNDGQITLNVTPPGASYTYVWNNGDNTGTIANLPPGNNYAVTVTDPQGCSTTGGPFTVTSPTQDSLSVTPLDTTMAIGDTIQLGSTLTGAYPATSYLWTPSYGLSCDTCPYPLFIPVDLDTVRTLYTLVATYYNGCKVSASDTLLARADNLVAIPDAFSPNGDGTNDTFKVYAWSVKEFHLAIYNRWGTLVFETDDVNVGWDGTYKGIPQPSEVYTFYFTVLHKNLKTESHEGSVTLFR